MSLLELFKNHVGHHGRNQMAEFKAGFYYSTAGVEMYHDLKECMENDDEALYMWGKAVEHLAHNEKDEFK